MFLVFFKLRDLKNTKTPYFEVLLEGVAPIYPLKGTLHFNINLGSKLVSTLLNNEFILKILISTPFGRKIRKRFWLKNHKSQISG